MNGRILTLFFIFVTCTLTLWRLQSGLMTVQANGTLPLSYSTFLGGSMADAGHSIALDSQGRIYVAGMSQSTDFPTGTLPLAPQHGVDSFVARFAPDGRTLEYVYWFNAQAQNQIDEAYGLAVDAAGAAYVTGETYSADFCQVFGLVPGYETVYQGSGDAFVFKVEPDGTSLAYCTFLGGSDWDVGRDIVVDATGNAFVTGGTWSADFPVTPNAPTADLQGLRDGFVVQLDAAGTAVSFATYLGGSQQDEAQTLAVTADGLLLVGGWTRSDDFYTTTAGLDKQFAGPFDGFITVLNPTQNSLPYAAYLGAAGEDRVTGLTAANIGSVYVTGYAVGPLSGATADLFVIRFNLQTPQLLQTVWLTGSLTDAALGITRGPTGMVYVTGLTASPDFAVTAVTYDDQLGGEQDAFVARFTPDLEPVFVSYLGGSAVDSAAALVVGDNERVCVTGRTLSPDFPLTAGAYDTNPVDLDGDALVTCWQFPEPFRLYLPLLGNR